MSKDTIKLFGWLKGAHGAQLTGRGIAEKPPEKEKPPCSSPSPDTK